VGETYNTVFYPIFSPDSKHFGFRAQKGEKWLVVMDGKEGKAYKEDTSPVFSPDSKHSAYLAQKEDTWVLVRDGVEGPAYASMASPTWSPDSAHLACLGEMNDSWLILVDGKPAKTQFSGFIKGSQLLFDSPKLIRSLAIRLPGPAFVRYNLTLP